LHEHYSPLFQEGDVGLNTMADEEHNVSPLTSKLSVAVRLSFAVTYHLRAGPVLGPISGEHNVSPISSKFSPAHHASLY